MHKPILKVFAILAVLFAAIQLVPYGRNHDNPPVSGEPSFSQPGAKELAVRACYDCHSNQTRWPWYSNIAPASWLIQRDVDQGRRVLNFSEWNRRQEEAAESAEAIAGGEMPPRQYLPLHPEARLAAAERQLLISALSAVAPAEHGSDEDDGD